MAASLSGALKQVVEAAGLGLAAYRDDAGTNVTNPKWVTISEGIVITTRPMGDDGDDDPVTELVQVDLWQPWRAGPDGGAAEDYTLADGLRSCLHGTLLTEAPMHVRSCKVDDVRRFVEKDRNLVHHALTLRIERERS